MTTYKKAIILPWDNASIEDEARWNGSQALFVSVTSDNGKVQSKGLGTITRVLNKGQVLEVIWRGEESCMKLSVMDYNIHLTKFVENETLVSNLMPITEPKDMTCSSFEIKEKGGYIIIGNALPEFQHAIGEVAPQTQVLKTRKQAQSICDHLNSQMVNAVEIETQMITLADGKTLEMCFVKELATGNIFALNGSYVEQEAGLIRSPYDNGTLTLGEPEADTDTKPHIHFPSYKHNPNLFEQEANKAIENLTNEHFSGKTRMVHISVFGDLTASIGAEFEIPVELSEEQIYEVITDLKDELPVSAFDLGETVQDIDYEVEGND